MKMPWIAELQDPIVFKDWTRSKTALKINSRLERFILENASAVVFLTEGARERAVRRTAADAAKIHVIYPGASPAGRPQEAYYRKEIFAVLPTSGPSEARATLGTFSKGFKSCSIKTPI